MVDEAKDLGDAVGSEYAETDLRNRQHYEDEVGDLKQRNRELESQLEKWKRRALALQEGYKDKSFEVTALEIQKMDLLAHGADRVVMRQNESLKTRLLAACIERNEARQGLNALQKITAAARALVWESENWEAYQDSKESNSAAWQPEFLLLAQAVEEKYGPMPVDDDESQSQ